MRDSSQVNQRLVRGQVAQVRRSGRRLRELAHLTKEEFTGNADNYAIAEHHLRRALEALFDAGRHVTTRMGLGVAEEYGDVPRLLKEGKILSAATAREAIRLAKLRNRLVHFYWQVNEEEMHEILQERLKHIEAFCKALLNCLQPPKGMSSSSGSSPNTRSPASRKS